MNRSPTAVIALACLAMAATTLTASAQARTVERAFVDAGHVELDLSAGTYRVFASRDNTIRITAYPTDSRSAGDTDVRIDVRGARATIAIDGPINDGVRVDIALPKRTNIVSSLTAGEFRLRDIEGSKDISARAGEIDIRVGEARDYRTVHAAVKIGELRAPAFKVNKGGFFRSFDWSGGGRHDLRVSLLVGEVKLE
jgi:hypothetical protein